MVHTVEIIQFRVVPCGNQDSICLIGIAYTIDHTMYTCTSIASIELRLPNYRTKL